MPVIKIAPCDAESKYRMTLLRCVSDILNFRILLSYGSYCALDIPDTTMAIKD